ncbi:MAG: type VI secretion system tip protein TssI/VgrG [Gemmatimonadota bacterium]
MPTYSQDTRPFQLTTPLGKDVLLCMSWTCSEAVSSLFDLRIVACSERNDIAAKELLLKTVSLKCDPKAGSERFFTGIVRHVERLPQDSGPLAEYVLHVVPPVWLLTLGSGFEVFQDDKMPDILKSVLTGLAVDSRLTGTYEPVPSRTRYDESKWNFVSRLMERDGLWYTFTHTATECKMLVADSMAAAEVRHGLDRMSDLDWKDDARLLSAHLWQQPFVRKTVVGTSHVALTGRENREQATAPDVSGGDGSWPLTAASLPAALEHQVYEYLVGADHDGVDKGGGAQDAKVGKVNTSLTSQATLRAQAEAAAATRLVGTSTATALAAGAKVNLKCSSQPGVDGKYFVLAVEHFGENGSYYGGDDASQGYSNQFTCINSTQVFRPPRHVPWPIVHGMHVATVIGPSGEEIFTDKHGRVRVAFEWNRDAAVPNGPGDSCWVRVAQMVAGPGFGSFFLPRVGHQVLVSFLGGDPDAPVVVGSLYNDKNAPQIKLPDDKDQSAMRTRSTPNGGKENFNELRFVDKKGSELVNFQAEKDFVGLIKNESKMVIDKSHETHTLNEGNQTLTIKKGNQTVTISEGEQSITISKGKRTIKVKDNLTTTVESGNEVTEVKTGKSTHEVMSDISIKSKSGKVVIEAPAGIELKCGGSTIKMTPASIEISSVQFKASGSAMAEVSGGGMLTLKGGVVMIN